MSLRLLIVQAARMPLRALDRALAPLRGADAEEGHATVSHTVPAPHADPAAGGAPLGFSSQASVSADQAEVLRLIQARLDLISERLDAHQALLGTQREARTEGSTRRAPVESMSWRRRETRELSDRLERLERLQRGPGEEESARDGLSGDRHGEIRDAGRHEPPLRSALRPPRVPSGLEMTDNGSRGASSHTDWDFAGERGLGPRLTGTFQDLRLATLLEVLQQERRVGILMLLRAGERTLEIEVRHGNVTAVRLDGADADSVAALREAFRWPNAEFVFLKSDRVRDSDLPPRSLQGVMLEVLQKNDEAARTG